MNRGTRNIIVVGGGTAGSVLAARLSEALPSSQSAKPPEAHRASIWNGAHVFSTTSSTAQQS
jgi:glycine/D-amino acid oxidase-like deaminating enzyme